MARPLGAVWRNLGRLNPVTRPADIDDALDLLAELRYSADAMQTTLRKIRLAQQEAERTPWPHDALAAHTAREMAREAHGAGSSDKDRSDV